MKAVKFFFGADLRGGHDMLIKQAKKAGVDLKDLAPAEAAVFINRAKDKLKSFSYNGVMSYIRFPREENRRIDMMALNELARAFDSRGVLNYNKALRQSLIKRLMSPRSAEKTLEIL